MVYCMKTTLELPDDLLQQAKETALRRKTTLKHLVEHALRRELNPTDQTPAYGYKVDKEGMPLLNQCRETITSETVYRLQHTTDLHDS